MCGMPTAEYFYNRYHGDEAYKEKRCEISRAHHERVKADPVKMEAYRAQRAEYMRAYRAAKVN